MTDQELLYPEPLVRLKTRLWPPFRVGQAPATSRQAPMKVFNNIDTKIIIIIITIIIIIVIMEIHGEDRSQLA